MTKREAELCAAAERIVSEMLSEGKKELGHMPDRFLQLPQDAHLDRAIRHICTARLIRDGSVRPDAEGVKGHLGRALVRLLMAIYIESKPADN